MLTQVATILQLGAGDMEATKNETGRMVREVRARHGVFRLRPASLVSFCATAQVARVLDDVGVEGLPYLHLVTNPDSFAQTVENVFYLSFLVRENKCAIDIEDKEDSPFYGDLVVCEHRRPLDAESESDAHVVQLVPRNRTTTRSRLPSNRSSCLR